MPRAPKPALDPQVERFVAARWHDAERAAYLVLGDPVRARSVTTDVFATLARDWPDVEGAPTAALRTRLAAALLADPALPVRDLPGLAGWATLSPTDRLVLAWAEDSHLTPAEIVAGLGRSAVEAADPSDITMVDDARIRASEIVGPQANLARDLTVIADASATITAPEQALAQALAARRARGRRRQLLAACGVAVVAGVAVAVTTGQGATPPGPISPGPTRPASPTPTGSRSVDWADPTTWQPRGALARDPDFHRQVQLRFGPLARILYAADDPDLGRVLWVWGRPSGEVLDSIQGFAGPQGASVGSLEQFSSTSGFVGAPILTYHKPDRAGGPTTVLLVAPDSWSAAKYSTYVRFGADGAVTREWSTLQLSQGIGRHTLPPGAGTALRFASVDGQLGDPSGMWLFGDPAAQTAANCPGCTSPVSREVAARLVGTLNSVTGARPGDVTVRLVHDVDLPGNAFALGPESTKQRLISVATTTPEGVVVRATQVQVLDRRGSVVTSAVVEDLVIVPEPWARFGALRIPVGLTDGRPSFAVLANRPVVSAGVGTSARVALRGGLALVTSPADATMGDLSLYDADGHRLALLPEGGEPTNWVSADEGGAGPAIDF